MVMVTSAFLKRMNQDGSMLDTLQKQKQCSSPAAETRADARTEADGGDITTRLLVAKKTQVDISKHREKIQGLQGHAR